MKERTYLLPVFLICVGCCLFIFLLFEIGWLGWLQTSLTSVFFPVGNMVSSTMSSLVPTTPSSELDKLKAENAELLKKLASQQQLAQDVRALRDQFKTTSLSPQQLLPARIVGAPSSVPHGMPELFVISLGSANGIKKGDVVVYKDNVVGQIAKVNTYYATVDLVISASSSFPGEENGVLGVVRGQGDGTMMFGNVLLSQTIHVGDVITTQGNQDISGKGYPPGLVVGKIISVEKNPSSLFQSGQVSSLLSFDKLTTVFVIKE